MGNEERRFRVFLIHAFEDLSLVKIVFEAFQGLPLVDLYVAEWERRPGELLSGKIEELIEKSDVALVIWSHNLEKSLMANQEIGYVRGLGKPIFPFVPKGMTLKGFLQGFEYLEFDPFNAEDDVKNLVGLVLSFAKKMGFKLE